MTKPVLIRYMLAGLGVIILAISYWFPKIYLAEGAAGVLLGLFISGRIPNKRPIYLRPSLRPHPLNLVNARRQAFVAVIFCALFTMLSLAISAGVINLPVRNVWCYGAGVGVSSTFCLVFPLQSIKQFVTEQNDWLKRMSASVDDFNVD